MLRPHTLRLSQLARRHFATYPPKCERTIAQIRPMESEPKNYSENPAPHLRFVKTERPRDEAGGKLRLLFCGSDDFSVECLRALDKLQQLEPDSIEWIRVVIKDEKHSSRGMKNIRINPVHAYVQERHVNRRPIIKLKQFSDFDAQLLPIDLIITASFGLKIDELNLTRSTYGGINIHPSLLPAYRGAAPIKHVILNEELHTGVTCQTLHPTQFDKGKILLQSGPIPIEIDETKVYPEYGRMGSEYHRLQMALARQGSRLLTQVIRNRLFMPYNPPDIQVDGKKLGSIDRDTKSLTSTTEDEERVERTPQEPSKAPKLDKLRLNQIVIPSNCSAKSIFRASLVTNKMYCYRRQLGIRDNFLDRVLLHGIRPFSGRLPEGSLVTNGIGGYGVTHFPFDPEGQESFVIRLQEGDEYISVEELQEESKPRVKALAWFNGTRKNKYLFL